MVSDDKPKEDDGRQADKTFQCQGIHGALQKQITQTQLTTYILKYIYTHTQAHTQTQHPVVNLIASMIASGSS